MAQVIKVTKNKNQHIIIEIYNYVIYVVKLLVAEKNKVIIQEIIVKVFTQIYFKKK